MFFFYKIFIYYIENLFFQMMTLILIDLKYRLYIVEIKNKTNIIIKLKIFDEINNIMHVIDVHSFKKKHA